MAYDGKVMRLALQKFEADRQERRDRFEQRRATIFDREPRLKAVDARLRSTASRIISSALRYGTDPTTAVEALREENLALQQEKRLLIDQLGLPEDALEETPACPLCGDTGYRNGSVCLCLRAYYGREQQRELSRMLDLGSQSFDTFLTEKYSEDRMPGKNKTIRQHMEEKVLDTCKEFAWNFGKTPGNLLLFGAPGLGKTHLSAAIAREVSGKGYSVVYDTAVHVFERFEIRKFSREESEVDADVNRILSCDLLILDDLGTEMTTAFVQSALYTIINTRLIEKKSTIISTNLMPSELSQRYSPQIASRIEGEYERLAFVGEDLRRKKREE